MTAPLKDVRMAITGERLGRWVGAAFAWLELPFRPIKEWPRWARRAFVLTLPASVPLLLAARVTLMGVVILVLFPIAAAHEFVAKTLVVLWREP